MSDIYVYEPEPGATIEAAARDALYAADPGDTLRFTFNGVTVDYPVPTSEDESLYPHARKLVRMLDAEGERLDREAPPQLGDIVVYVGDSTIEVWEQRRYTKREFIVASQPGPESTAVYCIEVAPAYSIPDYCFMPPASLRLVRRASYRTVGE